MFHSVTTPNSTRRPVVVVNITSASQPLETIATISGGAPNPPINPVEGIEDVDVRDYHSGSEGEHTTMANW